MFTQKPKELKIALMIISCFARFAKSSAVFIISFIFAGSIFSSYKTTQNTYSTSDIQVVSEMKSVLVNNILHVWYPAIIDTIHGGFYTNFSSTWERMPNQEKMIVTQSRDVWTACKAAERFPDDERYRKAADHGFEYLANVMWDKKEGGFLTLIGGKNDNTGWGRKHAYGNGFAMYALAAYYKLSHKAEALDLAKKTFYWLDSVAHDSEYGGYFNILDRSAMVDRKTNYGNYSFDQSKLKDYNSSIHIMEALAELYQVWPDNLVRDRLLEMLTLVRDTFTTSKGYLQLYFTADWRPILLRDSSEAKIRALIYLDHVSFGHDIETAFLLLEASKTLGIHNDTLTLKIAKRMVDHTLNHGFDKHYNGIFEGGYYFKGSDTITVVMANKNWWSQAEGLNALLLFSKLYPQEKVYKDAFYGLWNYVKKDLIDFEHGDWYSNGLDRSPEAKKQPKATAWKCNYHTGRSLMNCIDMLNGENILEH